MTNTICPYCKDKIDVTDVQGNTKCPKCGKEIQVTISAHPPRHKPPWDAESQGETVMWTHTRKPGEEEPAMC